MIKYAHIPEIQRGVTFSDPSYDETVWCQYRKDFYAKDWLMKMESQVEEGYVSFKLTLGRPTILAGVSTEPTPDGYSIKYPGRFDLQEYEIGMDTACVYCGLTEHLVTFGEGVAFDTGTDGLFGDLMVFTCKGEKDPAGFLLTGGIDDSFKSEHPLFHYFLLTFNAKEITQELFAEHTSPSNLSLRLAASEESKHAQESKAASKDGPSLPER